MSEESVEFDDENVYVPRAIPRQESAGTRLLIKLGLAKDERSAQIVYLCIAGAGFLLTAIIFFSLASSSKPLPANFNPNSAIPR